MSARVEGRRRSHQPIGKGEEQSRHPEDGDQENRGVQLQDHEDWDSLIRPEHQQFLDGPMIRVHEDSTPVGCMMLPQSRAVSCPSIENGAVTGPIKCFLSYSQDRTLKHKISIRVRPTRER